MRIIYDSFFKRKLLKTKRNNPLLYGFVSKTIKLISIDPFDDSLNTHKLKGTKST